MVRLAARGKVHPLAGAPGTGKTSVALALAATLTTAGGWPDGSTAAAGAVLIWSGEDDPLDTLVPRLLACGADLSRIHFMGSVSDQDGTRAFDPARELLGKAESMDDPDERSALDDAKAWLRHTRSLGALDGKERKRLARIEGIPERTLYRAAGAFGVGRRAQGFGKA